MVSYDYMQSIINRLIIQQFNIHSALLIVYIIVLDILYHYNTQTVNTNAVKTEVFELASEQQLSSVGQVTL